MYAKLFYCVTSWHLGWVLCYTSLYVDTLFFLVISIYCGEVLFTLASLWSEYIRTHLAGKMRPLHWVELRVLVKTLLNRSFGHRFKQNINQARSVWTKAQICLEDLQTSENTVQVLHITLKSKLARIWSPLQKLCTAPVRHLFQTFHLNSMAWEDFNSPFLQLCRKKITVTVWNCMCTYKRDLQRNKVCFTSRLGEENTCKVFQP